MTEQQPEQMSETKKIVIYATVGTVLVLSIIGAVVPESRAYVTEMAKGFMATIGTMVK